MNSEAKKVQKDLGNIFVWKLEQDFLCRWKYSFNICKQFQLLQTEQNRFQ